MFLCVLGSLWCCASRLGTSLGMFQLVLNGLGKQMTTSFHAEVVVFSRELGQNEAAGRAQIQDSPCL